jgi:ankyrin repeat protein
VKLLKQNLTFVQRSGCRALLLCAVALSSTPLVAQPLAVPKPEQVQASPVADAARRGDHETVQALLQQGQNVNGLDSAGTPALHWAVHVNDLELVNLLLAAGADLSLKNRYGQAPIHIAVQQRHAAMAQRLLQAGANIEQADAAGEPPLLTATRLGDAGMVEVLLKQGAQVDARDVPYGQTALMMAVREEHASLAQRLLAVTFSTHTGRDNLWRPPTASAIWHGSSI